MSDFTPIIAALSGVAGVIAGMIGARYTWHKDKRESDEAEDKASDRLIDLLKEQNALAIENERMRFEAELQRVTKEQNKRHREELDKLRTSLMADIDRRVRDAVADALDAYGCENAPECNNRRPRKRDTAI